MKKFPDNDAFKKINKLVFEFNKRLSYPWTVHFDDIESKLKCDGMLYNAQIRCNMNTDNLWHYYVSNQSKFNAKHNYTYLLWMNGDKELRLRKYDYVKGYWIDVFSYKSKTFSTIQEINNFFVETNHIVEKDIINCI